MEWFKVIPKLGTTGFKVKKLLNSTAAETQTVSPPLSPLLLLQSSVEVLELLFEFVAELLLQRGASDTFEL